MRSRKEIKKSARSVVKKHYLILLLVCLIASFIGAEFSSSTIITRNTDNIINAEGKILEKTKAKMLDKTIKKQIKTIEREKEKIAGDNSTKKRGVFASAISTVSNGNIFLKLVDAITSITSSKSIGIMISILISFIFIFSVWYFLQNTYKVISRRIFLESRIYEKVSYQKFLFLIRTRKLTSAAFTMFVVKIYQWLWNLTIIGGIIKRYSYYLVPYIVAENPTLKPNEAITLSRNMMNNHKLECFKMELSFIVWEILGVITINISKLFYSNMYKVATFTEYYVELRSLAIKNHVGDIEKLNDKYLYERPSKELVDKEYYDIIKLDIKKPVRKDKNIKYFLANYFGISLYDEKEEKKIEEEQVNQMRYANYKNIILEKMYPSRLSPIKEKEKLSKNDSVNYLRRYKITSLIILFFIFSGIGWIWEVALHLITNGTFVNKGTMHGPWLPIYGWGGILILTILYRFRKNPKLEFLLTVIICGLVEYFTSFYLEMVHHFKWWDYSGYFLNLNGRICAEGLLVFGLGGLAIVYLVAPLIDNHIKKINKNALVLICVFLLVIFMFDQKYSSENPNTGKGITSYSFIYLDENMKKV